MNELLLLILSMLWPLQGGSQNLIQQGKIPSRSEETKIHISSN